MRTRSAAADELLIGTIVKPTAGLTPVEVADICYQTAAAGVRFIKDDEKMMNTSYCPLAERVERVREALDKAQSKTGQKCIYAAHITTDAERIPANAHTALAAGADALMLNFFAAGFAALKVLVNDPDINVPLYAHCGGKEAFGRAEGQGVSPEVVAKFVRLMGGDYMRGGILGSYLVGGSKDELLSLWKAFKEPMGGIRRIMPALSGGLKPANLVENLELFGTDCMYLAGTGITRHPMGIGAGVAAMNQAAEAFRRGISVSEYARSHPELKAGLTY